MGCTSSKKPEENDEEICNLSLNERNETPVILDSKDFKMTKFLQQGGMGVVYAGVNASGEKIACKLFGYNDSRAPDEQAIQKEIKLLMALQGVDGVVKLHVC